MTITDNEKELLAMFRALNDYGQRTTINIVEGLTKVYPKNVINASEMFKQNNKLNYNG